MRKRSPLLVVFGCFFKLLVQLFRGHSLHNNFSFGQHQSGMDGMDGSRVEFKGSERNVMGVNEEGGN